MNIAEMQQRRTVLESEIAALIAAFEAATGVIVGRVDVEHVRIGSGATEQRMLMGVSVAVELP